MASIVAPAPVGGFLEGFSGGLTRGANLRGARDVARLRELQIAQAQDEATQRSMMRSIVPQILSAQPQAVEVAPGRPAELQWGQEEGAGVQAVTPAQPPVTENMLTHQMLARQIGPEALGRAVTRPEGQLALKAAGVITDEEATRRRRRGKAFAEYKGFLDESRKAYQAGDAEQGLLKEMAAYQAAAEAADDPVPLRAKVADLHKTFYKLRGDREQTEKAGRDMQRLATALAAYHETGDFESYSGVQQAIVAAESDYGRKKAHEMLLAIGQGKDDQIKFMPFRQIEARASQIMAQQPGVSIGQPPNRLAALREAMQQNPDATARIVGAMVGQGKVPDDYAQALFGRTPTMKNVYDLANESARSRNLISGSPEYADFVTKEVIRIERGSRPAERDREMQELNSTLSSLTRREANLGRELETAIRESDRAPIRQELGGVRTQIHGIQQRLQERGIGKPASTQTPTAADQKRTLDAVLTERYGGRRLRDLSPADRQRVADEVNRRLGLIR